MFEASAIRSISACAPFEFYDPARWADAIVAVTFTSSGRLDGQLLTVLPPDAAAAVIAEAEAEAARSPANDDVDRAIQLALALVANAPELPLRDPNFRYVRKLAATIQSIPAERISQALVDALVREGIRVRISRHHTIEQTREASKLEDVIDAKRADFESLMRRQAAGQIVDDRAARAQRAEEEHGAAIDELGLPSEFLDATIVSVTLMGQRRMGITIRQWLALAFATDRYELVEGRQLDQFDALGVRFKESGQRPYELYFVMSGSDVFPEFWGDDGRVQRLRPDERLQATVLINAVALDRGAPAPDPFWLFN